MPVSIDGVRIEFILQYGPQKYSYSQTFLPIFSKFTLINQTEEGRFAVALEDDGCVAPPGRDGTREKENHELEIPCTMPSKRITDNDV